MCGDFKKGTKYHHRCITKKIVLVCKHNRQRSMVSQNELNIVVTHTHTHIYIYIYIRSPMGVEHFGEGIVGHRSHNVKLFERIEHSGSR